MDGNTTMVNYSKDHYFHRVLNICAYYTMVNPEDVISESRLKIISLCRKMFVYAVMDFYPYYTNKDTTTTKLGAFLNGRDHSTIVSLNKSFTSLLHSKKEYKSLYYKVSSVLSMGTDMMDYEYQGILEILKTREGNYSYHSMSKYELTMQFNSILDMQEDISKKQFDDLEIKKYNHLIDGISRVVSELINKRNKLLNEQSGL